MRKDSSQWAVLAATRFVLASVVLTGHLNYLPGYHPWTAVGLFLNQGSAVYGFLMISGYSIAASLDRSAEGFFARRFRRIWPSYLVSLALGVAVALAVKRPVHLTANVVLQPLVWSELLASLTMTQTFLAPALSADGQIWTLAVEWWDYMLAPVIRRWSTPILSVIVAISLAYYCLVPPPENPANTTGGWMFLVLAWWWLSGFLYYRHRGTALGYALLVLPPLFAASYGWIGRAAFIGIAALASCEYIALSDRVSRLFNWLGDLSYPLYLVHVPVMFAFNLFHFYDALVVAFGAILTSAVVLHLVDYPLRRPGRPLGIFKWKRIEAFGSGQAVEET